MLKKNPFCTCLFIIIAESNCLNTVLQRAKQQKYYLLNYLLQKGKSAQFIYKKSHRLLRTILGFGEQHKF